MTIHNPAQRDFIRRPKGEPVLPTRALSLRDAKRLLRLPTGDTALAYRDRAVLAFYLYTGARISTGCRLDVNDVIVSDDDSAVHVQEKGHGKRKRLVGVHHAAVDALQEYIEAARLTGGPLFRAQYHWQQPVLAERRMSIPSMWRLLTGYLQQLPNAVQTVTLDDGLQVRRCVYSPHSLRATTATLLLDDGVDIAEVQRLLGHKQITTTQIYDKRRRQVRASASHKVPL